jgi:hypothetical protein
MTETQDKPRASMRELIDSAIRFWELRRIAYNGFLMLIVLTHMVIQRGEAEYWLFFETFLQIFMLSVVANFLYCFAYIIDLPAQYSSYRQQWLQWRWILWVIGMLFAASIATQIMQGMLYPDL